MSYYDPDHDGDILCDIVFIVFLLMFIGIFTGWYGQFL